MMISFYKEPPPVVNRVYPGYLAAIKANPQPPHIVRASDGQHWIVLLPLPEPYEGITAHLILGVYRWRWQARLRLWWTT